MRRVLAGANQPTSESIFISRALSVSILSKARPMHSGDSDIGLVPSAAEEVLDETKFGEGSFGSGNGHRQCQKQR